MSSINSYNFQSDEEAQVIDEKRSEIKTSTESLNSTTCLARAASKIEAGEASSSSSIIELPKQTGINDKTRKLRRIFPSNRKSEHVLIMVDMFFSVYRRLFGFIFAVNVVALIVFMALNDGYPTLTNVKNATQANILASVMMRQENCVNLIYDIATCWPLSTPLAIRRKLAEVYHYGGVHSGCGVAAVVWFLLYTGLTSREYVNNPSGGLPVANVILCFLLIMLYLTIIFLAHPKFRSRFHDTFEMTHRYSGWLSFAILWAQTIILAKIAVQQQSKHLGLVLVKNPGFWFLIISTGFIAVSWGRLRPREVRAEVLSSHATRLHFTYKDMKPLYGLKVSDKPLTEWHAFATIPGEDGKGFSFIVSKAGDWTTKTINNPPKKLWTRGFPVHGPLYGARLFHKVIVVATGSGIGPCMSFFADNRVPLRVFWSTRDPEKTYGQGVIDFVKKADSNAIIWNTSQKGYPDIVMEVYKLYVEFGAEAVYCISNPKVENLLKFGLKTRGIPVYGPIFDS